jgi:hypothetical protein
LTKENRSVTSEKDKDSKPVDPVESKKSWQPMRLSFTGEAKDVVRGGGGKTSPSPNDPGDVRKPSGQG